MENGSSVRFSTWSWKTVSLKAEVKREPGLIAKIDVTALHLEYRRGHGFESRLSTIFFFHFGPKFKHDSFFHFGLSFSRRLVSCYELVSRVKWSPDTAFLRVRYMKLNIFTFLGMALITLTCRLLRCNLRSGVIFSFLLLYSFGSRGKKITPSSQKQITEVKGEGGEGMIAG